MCWFVLGVLCLPVTNTHTHKILLSFEFNKDILKHGYIPSCCVKQVNLLWSGAAALKLQTLIHVEECSVLCLGLTFCPKVYSFQGVDCQICEMACGRGRRRQGKRYLTRLTSHQPFHLKRASVRGISDRAMNKPVVHTFFCKITIYWRIYTAWNITFTDTKLISDVYKYLQKSITGQ